MLGGAADLVGDGRGRGGADGVRDGLGLGLRVGLADGVGVALRVALGVAEGAGEAVAVGVTLGSADGDGSEDDGAAEGEAVEDGAVEDGAAEAADVDEPETGAASAGRMIATVEILAGGPGRTLACTPPAPGRRAGDAVAPVPGEQASAVAAQAVAAPRIVRALRLAART